MKHIKTFEHFLNESKPGEVSKKETDVKIAKVKAEIKKYKDEELYKAPKAEFEKIVKLHHILYTLRFDHQDDYIPFNEFLSEWEEDYKRNK